jgi:hypothetical protein
MIDEWWDRQGIFGPMIYIFIYLLMVAFVWQLGMRQRWNIHVRWISEMGVRQGLRIGGIPLIDFGLLCMCLLLALVTLRFSITQFDQILYLVGPMIVNIVICLLTAQPDKLDDIITEPIRLRDYALMHGIDYVVLARENNIADQENPLLTFGQRIRLPLN